MLIVIPQEKPCPDPDIHLSSPSLSLNTTFVPTNTVVKNTVVMYCWFIQKETSDISGPVLAVAVRIKSFGMVKVQCTHTADEINHVAPDILKSIT